MKKTLILAAFVFISTAVQAQGLPSPAAVTSAPAPAATVPAPLTPTATATVPTAVEAAPAVNNDWMTYKNPYEGEQNNLANPNRTDAEIAAWTQKAIASALSFGPSDVNEKITEAKKMFVDKGWAEYADYVKEAQLMERVRQQNMTLSTILNGEATIIAKDAVGGTYHWLVRAPVLMTFMKPDETAVGKQSPAGTGKFTLTLQIGRADKKIGDDGIVIESWKIEAVQP